MFKTITKVGAAALMALGLTTAQAQVSRIVPVNGTVRASVLNTTTGILYIGGDFTVVNQYLTRNGAIISTATGLPELDCPEVNGTVRASVPDGAGGWFIGGDFSQVGGVVRNRLAHINANKSVTGWNPDANNSVLTLAISGSTVYAGGAFTAMGGQTRNYLAAIDAVSGSVTGWNPDANQQVRTLAISGSTVYAGGLFTTIAGITRNRLAAIDVVSGTVTGWNPDANSTVRTLAISGSTVYAGGNFTTVAGITRNCLAAIDAVTGSVTGWNPDASSGVNTLAISGSTVYAGGQFTAVGGQSRNRLAAIDAVSGSVTGWNPNANNNVNTLAISGSVVYAGGGFTTVAGVERRYLAAIDAVSGTVTGWNPNADNIVLTLAISGSTVYAGGQFTNVGGQPRNRLAAIDAVSGTVTGWNPDANSTVFTLAISGSTVYAGGLFTTVAGITRNRLAAIDVVSGSVTGWNPDANGPVSTLAVSGSTVYAGGQFTTVAGMTRNRLVAIDAVSGSVTGWNPDANGQVNTLAISGSTVYAGGNFTTVAGVERRSLAAIDAVSGSVTGWNPNANSIVLTLAISGSTVYAGGNFTTVAGVERRSLAAIDAVSGSVTGWNPDANSIVFTLAISGSTVYAGGVFTNLFGGTGGWVGLAPAYIARLDTRINQTITGLSSAINVVYGAANQTLTGVAGSALPVVYVSSNTAVASVSGSVLAFVGAGNATITASNLGNNDYFPAQDVQIAVTVTPKSATISGANATRVYGEANPIFTGTVLGLVNGDAISFFGITAATSLSGIGTYPITATVMGANILNYQFSILNSVLTITKANLTVSADNFSRQYGLANPTFTGSITGAVNGDVITPSFNTTGLQTSNAGMYTISVIGINNGNYALIAINGTLTVTKAPLTITGPNITRTYGTAINVSLLTPSISGTVFFGDGITINSSTNVNTNADVGTYPVNVEPVGAKVVNYNITTIAGVQTIEKANQNIINFGPFDDITINGINTPSPTLTATASSGLTVVFSISGAAFISNNAISVTGTGEITVTASQAGNNNFLPALTLTRTFNVSSIVAPPTGLPTYQSTSFIVYPNPVVNGEWRIENGEVGATMYVFNAQGTIVYTQSIASTSTLVSAKLSSGIYLVKVGTQMVKLVVE